jgi:hypothetical protein
MLVHDSSTLSGEALKAAVAVRRREGGASDAIAQILINLLGAAPAFGQARSPDRFRTTGLPGLRGTYA